MIYRYAATLGLAWALLGCASDPTSGYTALSAFPSEVTSVSVPIFENSTYDRQVEFDLADALVKEIEATTPYKVMSSRRASTSLTGRITRVEREQISKSPRTGLGEETVLSVTVDFVWRDLRTGKVLVERKNFVTHALFTPSRPNSEPEELGRFSVVQQLARDIVDQMRGDW
jgi:hypothetical protein